MENLNKQLDWLERECASSNLVIYSPQAEQEYVTAEEAGMNPENEMKAIGAGLPSQFSGYAVVKSRRNQSG